MPITSSETLEYARRGVVSFRNWFSDVQRFVFVVTWSEELLVPTAAAFLIGDALRWWDKHSATLGRMGQDVSSCFCSRAI
jgi:hypothetical protein